MIGWVGFVEKKGCMIFSFFHFSFCNIIIFLKNISFVQFFFHEQY